MNLLPVKDIVGALALWLLELVSVDVCCMLVECFTMLGFPCNHRVEPMQGVLQLVGILHGCWWKWIIHKLLSLNILTLFA